MDWSAPTGQERLAAQLNLLGSHDTPRARTLCGGDMDAVRLAMLLQMTLPGAPCVYYGDEIGMEGLMDPDCRRAFPSDPLRGNVSRRPGLPTWSPCATRAARSGMASWRCSGPTAWRWPICASTGTMPTRASSTPLTCHSRGTSTLPVGCSSADLVLLRGERQAGHARLVGDRQLRVELPARHGSIVRLGSAQRS